MIQLFNLKYLGLLIGLLSILIFLVFQHCFDVKILQGISYTISTVSFLILFLSLIWQIFWKIPILSKRIFPNLSGKWKIKIYWQDTERNTSGEIDGTAIIRHTLIKIAMAVKTEGSNSETICVHLIKLDSDTKKIAYIYKNSFKDKLNTRSQNQTGAVILTINEFFNAMEGNYFTDGNTKGTVYLSRA